MFNETIELITNDPEKVLKLTFTKRHSFDEEGFIYEFLLELISGSFSCKQSFNIDDESMNHILTKLPLMYQEMKGSLSIGEKYEPNIINLELNSLGHLIVNGELTDFSNNSLDFRFQTDQTALPRFISGFQELNEYLR